MRRYARRHSLFLTLAAMLFLTACGGGGDGSPLDPVTPATPGDGAPAAAGTVPAAIASPALTDSGGATLAALTIETGGTFGFQVNDDAGNPVPGLTGDFTFSVPVTGTSISREVATGTVTLDASGNGQIDLSITEADLGGEGTLTVTFTAPDGALVAFTEQITVDQIVGIPATLTLTLTSPDADVGEDQIGTQTPSQLLISIRDAFGNAPAGSLVEQGGFSVAIANDNTLVTQPAQVVIGASGDATVEVTAAEPIAPTASLAVVVSVDLAFTTLSGVAITLSESELYEIVPNDAVAPGEPVPSSITLLLRDTDPNTDPATAITSISASTPGELLVTVLDNATPPGPVAGEIVNVTTTLGTLAPSSGNILTDASGQATIDIAVGAGEPGEAGTLTATIGSLTESTSFTIVDSGTTSTSGFAISVALYNDEVDLTTADPSDPVNDPQLANRTQTINSVENGILGVLIEDSLDGNPIEGIVVTVTTTAGVLVPGSGQVLTNADGIASVEVQAGTEDPGSAGTLTASLADVTASTTFSVGSFDLLLGFDLDNSGVVEVANTAENGQIGINGVTDGSVNLAPTGSAALTVAVVNPDGTPFETPLTVNFTSGCAANGDAVIGTGITTVSGVAQSTYEATGCAGQDNIIASVAELSGVEATGTLTVADAAASSIQFISATPTDIALAGTGGIGRQEFSTLVFQVVDEAGMPVANQLVSLSLTTTVGGLNLTGDMDNDGDLDDSGAIDERVPSNTDGQVSVIVNAGTVSVSAQVVASIEVGIEEISTVSDSLIVSTGLPDNNSFSLSATVLSPGGFDVDNLESTINILAADAFNNPVPDGTVISFTTEYGRVDDSCVTVNGGCSVLWNSQDPRAPNLASTGTVLTILDSPCDSNADGVPDIGSDGLPVPVGVPCQTLLVDPADPDFPGQIAGNRTTIIATALGEESFIDANGNGMFDSGEAFVDLPEAFIDHNEDNEFGNSITIGGCAIGVGACEEGGAEETFIDLNTNGQYDQGNGIYNGSLCSEAAELAGDCTTDLISVRDSVVLSVGSSSVFSGVYDDAGTLLINDASRGIFDQNVTITGGEIVSRTIRVSDQFNGPLLGGSATFSVTAENCDLLSSATGTIADGAGGNEGGFEIVVSLAEDEEDSTTSGSVAVSVTRGSEGGFDDGGGAIQVASFMCEDDQPAPPAAAP